MTDEIDRFLEPVRRYATMTYDDLIAEMVGRLIGSGLSADFIGSTSRQIALRWRRRRAMSAMIACAGFTTFSSARAAG